MADKDKRRASGPNEGDTSGQDATGREAPEDGPAGTPVEATRSTPPAPGQESLREALHRRMRELDDRSAEESAPDGELGPQDEPPD
ncbi:hypothetical protein [Streptomyces sp. NBC_00648]|uniref:hypothetical protein n=1 Tax=Streptomyces sp. NBC_00648 TaxID=2975797 RepID=UPI003255E5BA